MKQNEKEWILELIKKHQKSMRSHISSIRSDTRTAESFKMDGNKHMVEWCEEQRSRHWSAMRAQREIIRELAQLGEIPIREAFLDIFLEDEIKSISIGRGIRILDVDDVPHRPHIRELIARVA